MSLRTPEFKRQTCEGGDACPVTLVTVITASPGAMASPAPVPFRLPTTPEAQRCGAEGLLDTHGDGGAGGDPKRRAQNGCCGVGQVRHGSTECMIRLFSDTLTTQ